MAPAGQVCQYSINIKLQNVTLKLKEGFPYYLSLESGQKETFKFINLYDSNEKITILLEVSAKSFVDTNLMGLSLSK